MTLRVSASDEIMYNSVSAFLFHEQLQDGFLNCSCKHCQPRGSESVEKWSLLAQLEVLSVRLVNSPSVLHDASCSWIHQVQLFVALCLLLMLSEFGRQKDRSSLLFHIHHHSTNSTNVVDLLLFSLNLWLALKELTKCGTKSLLKHTP